jgi:hypothetical protein
LLLGPLADLGGAGLSADSTSSSSLLADQGAVRLRSLDAVLPDVSAFFELLENPFNLYPQIPLRISSFIFKIPQVLLEILRLFIYSCKFIFEILHS